MVLEYSSTTIKIVWSISRKVLRIFLGNNFFDDRHHMFDLQSSTNLDLGSYMLLGMAHHRNVTIFDAFDI